MTDCHWIQCVFPQETYPFCGPNEESCVLAQSSKRHDCMVSCTGLHADIRKEDMEVKESLGQIAKGCLFLILVHQYLQAKIMIFPAMATLHDNLFEEDTIRGLLSSVVEQDPIRLKLKTLSEKYKVYKKASSLGI